MISCSEENEEMAFDLFDAAEPQACRMTAPAMAVMEAHVISKKK